MSVKNCEKLEKSMVALTVEVGAAEFEAAIEKAYKKQRGSIRLRVRQHGIKLHAFHLLHLEYGNILAR
jgi:hypothetical protein